MPHISKTNKDTSLLICNILHYFIWNINQEHVNLEAVGSRYWPKLSLCPVLNYLRKQSRIHWEVFTMYKVYTWWESIMKHSYLLSLFVCFKIRTSFINTLSKAIWQFSQGLGRILKEVSKNWSCLLKYEDFRFYLQINWCHRSNSSIET